MSPATRKSAKAPMTGTRRLRRRTSARLKRSGKRSSKDSSNSEPVRCGKHPAGSRHHLPPSERKDEVMTNVAESTGTVNFDQELTDTRQVWRAAVQAVADKATAALPQCQSRIEKALSLVLAGDVDLLGDGTARVASQSHGQTIYHIVNGHCDCRDYEHAAEAWCKHRLAHAIAKRAYTQAKAKLDTGAGGQPTPAQPAPVAPPLPEAPASVNVHLELHGRQVQLTLRDADE